MNTFILLIIVIGLISIPIILTFIILGLVSKKMRPNIKYALISLVFAFICIIAGSISYTMLESPATTKTTKTNQNKNQSFENNISVTNSPKLENEPETQTVSSAKELDSPENILLELFPSSNNDYKNIEIIPAYDEGYYYIQYDYMGGAWNESDFVKTCISDYIAYCKDAYKEDFVNCIRFSVFIPMKDSNDNESIDHILTMQISKNVFNTFNWDNYENLPIYDTFVNNSETFYLAPNVGNYIDKEKITFSSYSKLFSYEKK